MEKWTAEKLKGIGFSTYEYKATDIGDAYCLTSFKGVSGHRGYAIYKIFSNNKNNYAYVMVLKSSLFLAPPVLLSENQTVSMLNNPKEAIIFANKIWKSRYQTNIN